MDGYNSTKDSLLNIQTYLRYKSIEISAHWNKKGRRDRREDRDGSHRCNPALVTAPSDAIAVKGQGAAPIGQTRVAETEIRLRRPAHTESEPRVMGREAVQRVAALHKLRPPDKSADAGICPAPSLL